jgi:hypothetical protein
LTIAVPEVIAAVPTEDAIEPNPDDTLSHMVGAIGTGVEICSDGLLIGFDIDEKGSVGVAEKDCTSKLDKSAIFPSFLDSL